MIDKTKNQYKDYTSFGHLTYKFFPLLVWSIICFSKYNKLLKFSHFIDLLALLPGTKHNNAYKRPYHLVEGGVICY